MSSTPPPGEPPVAANEPAPVAEGAPPVGGAPPVAEGAAPVGGAPPAGGATPPPLPPPPPPGYGGWAPVPRRPRVPWVNPDRRLHLAGAAIVAGLVLLGGGIGIGWAASSGGDHHRDLRGGYGDMRGPGMMRGDYPGMQFPRGQRPQFPNPNPPATSATPAPTPTK